MLAQQVVQDAALYRPTAQVLLAYRLVVADASGELIYADSRQAGHAGRVLGMVVSAYQAGEMARVVTEGEISNSGWSWAVNDRLYLGRDGALTVNPRADALSLPVGLAVSATKIVLRIGRGVLII